MLKYKLIVSPAAKSDIKDIYQSGIRQWGQVQSDQYLDTIKDILWKLTEQPEMGIARPELLSNTRSLAIKRHIIFYRIAADCVEVLRILHGRQDPQRQF